VECCHSLSTRSASRTDHSSATTHQAQFLLAIHKTTACNSIRRKTKAGEWLIRCSSCRCIHNWVSSSTGLYLGRGALMCRRMKVWRKRTAMPMLMLVSPPQQQLSRPMQQRHTRLCRAHRTSRHSLQRNLHMKMNPTTVVGETSCMRSAASHTLMASYPLFSLLPLDITRRFL